MGGSNQTSTGQGLGGLGGAIIGGLATMGTGGVLLIPGILMGASLGFSAGGMIDPPTPKTYNALARAEDIQGPTVKHNVPVPIIYGTYTVVGNVFFVGKASSKMVKLGEEEQEVGGKDGTKDVDQTERWYALDFALCLGEGPIQGVDSVFHNQKDITSKEGEKFTTYLGTATQEVPHIVDKAVLADGDVPWRYTAYLLWSGNIGAMNSIPMLESHVKGIDTTVSTITTNALTL